MAALPPGFIPNPQLDQLKEFYIGKQLGDVPTPAAVVDRAVVERNCAQMLDACRAAGVSFRPHVKTHKVLIALLFIRIAVALILASAQQNLATRNFTVSCSL